MKIVNPATEMVIADVATDSVASIEAKFARARAAQKAWAHTPLSHRIDVIRAFRDLLVKQSAKLSLVLTREMGKPIRQSHNELNATPGRIDFFLSEVAAMSAPELVHREGDQLNPSLEEVIAYEPLGVIANVSAWNYPYFVGSNVFIPALLTGNAVLYKPSEHASMTGAHIAELLHEAGVPRDVFVPVIGAGDVGAALVAQPLDGVYFTGSYATGKRIAESTASRMIRTQLELGGKDPTYVCDDVDIGTAVDSLADGAFYNNGQSCCSVERIYVHESIYGAFLARFVDAVKAFVVGDPEDDKTYIGPLARRDQIVVLEQQIADAREKGAHVLVGGHRIERRGAYFAPTVLENVTNEMAVMRDESFGPVIGIASVKNDEDALAKMNDTDYGLTAGVYTNNRARAEAILSQVASGSVYWNCCDRVSPRLPWTGRRHSGIGSTLSRAGIRAFQQPKAWHLRAR